MMIVECTGLNVEYHDQKEEGRIKLSANSL